MALFDTETNIGTGPGTVLAGSDFGTVCDVLGLDTSWHHNMKRIWTHILGPSGRADFVRMMMAVPEPYVRYRLMRFLCKVPRQVMDDYLSIVSSCTIGPETVLIIDENLGHLEKDYVRNVFTYTNDMGARFISRLGTELKDYIKDGTI